MESWPGISLNKDVLACDILFSLALSLNELTSNALYKSGLQIMFSFKHFIKVNVRFNIKTSVH